MHETLSPFFRVILPALSARRSWKSVPWNDEKYSAVTWAHEKQNKVSMSYSSSSSTSSSSHSSSSHSSSHSSFPSLTHSEWRHQNIYSQEEINLYFIIKLATQNYLFSLQISKTWCFYVDKIKYGHLAIHSNKKISQFAQRIVIFNFCMCCQFEDSEMISPKIIPVSHHNI